MRASCLRDKPFGRRSSKSVGLSSQKGGEVKAACSVSKLILHLKISFAGPKNANIFQILLKSLFSTVILFLTDKSKIKLFEVFDDNVSFR